MEHLPQGTLFGFEFTFTNQNTLKIIEGGSCTPEILAWWKLLNDQFSDCNNAGREIVNDHNIIGIPVYKYEYPDDDNFWLKFSVDPGVVEIQTKPITYAQIVDNHILNNLFYFMFGTGRMTKGEGGGHINVDYHTGFGGSFPLVIKMIQASEDYYLNFICNKIGVPSVIEVSNLQYEPFLNCDRENKANYANWQRTVAAKENMEQFKKDHIEWLLNHPTEGQKKTDKLEGKTSAEREVKALHYQAVNIAHLYEANNEDKRLEFRFFSAQESVDDIIKCIDIIDKIKESADTKTYKDKKH